MVARLVFDGECGFCRWTVRYAERVTGSAVEYRPYQEVAAEHPQVDEAGFRAAQRWFAAGEPPLAGAAAAFRALAEAPGHGVWWWAYRRVPGFAPLTERLYKVVAANRPTVFALGRALHGAELEPARFVRIATAWRVALGLIAVAAGASFAPQVAGLIGARGITPVADFLPAATAALGTRAWWMVPSLFWLDHRDALLTAAAWGVALGGALLAFGVKPRLTAFVAWALWLSLCSVAQEWLQYQWDWLLLECLICSLLCLRGEALGAWVMRLLWFRFAFLSGVVKWTSGDPSWHDLSALSHHFETQPLPAPLAWSAHHLPPTLLAALTAGTLFIELVLPWAVFLPRRPRMLAAWAFIALQLGILATGNYNYFNLLALALTLWLFDDRALRQVGVVAASRLAPRSAPLAAGACAVLLVLGLAQIWRSAAGPLPVWLAAPHALIAPFGPAGAYGPFAVMTTQRFEVRLEGTLDGAAWRPYRLPYAPAADDRALPFVTPRQPRLDWQLWFAALGPREQSPWMDGLVVRLLEAEPTVLALFAADPFHGRAPRAVRARFEECWFTDAAERAARDRVWHCEDRGLWLAPSSLAAQSR